MGGAVLGGCFLAPQNGAITASLQLAIEAPSPILISVGFCRDHRWRFCLSGEQTLRFANLVTGLRHLEPRRESLSSMWLTLRKYVLAVALLVAFSSPVLARDDGRHANDPLKYWFDNLSSENGMCCSFADGLSVNDVDWDMQNSHCTANGSLCRIRQSSADRTAMVQRSSGPT